MIVKVMSMEDLKINYECGTMYFEADQIQYNRLARAEPNISEDTIYLYADAGDVSIPEQNYLAQLFLIKDEKTTQILLKNADVFIMNDQGKTVDRICA